MPYPTTEYAYVDEYGQSVDPSNFTEQVYADNNEQIVFDGQTFDNQPQQIQGQYRTVVATDGSQPL